MNNIEENRKIDELSDVIDKKINEFRKNHYIDISKQGKKIIACSLMKIYKRTNDFKLFKEFRDNAPSLFELSEYRSCCKDFEETAKIIVNKLYNCYNFDVVLEVRSIVKIISEQAEKYQLHEIVNILKVFNILDIIEYIKNHEEYDKFGLFNISMYNSYEDLIEKSREFHDLIAVLSTKNVNVSLKNAILDYLAYL